MNYSSPLPPPPPDATTVRPLKEIALQAHPGPSIFFYTSDPLSNPPPLLLFPTESICWLGAWVCERLVLTCIRVLSVDSAGTYYLSVSRTLLSTGQIEWLCVKWVKYLPEISLFRHLHPPNTHLHAVLCQGTCIGHLEPV